jgi:heterodisulfide reductase subunit B2
VKYLYYPGCSQKATSRPYEKSFLAVCSRLGVELEEVNDWNCCGATMAISTNKVLALALPARNLAIAEKTGLPVVTPCPSCWLSFKKVNKTYHDEPELAEKVNDALAAGGLTYRGKTNVHHAMDFLVHQVGIEKIQASVRTPLQGLRVAPYYGCQVVRPYADGDDQSNPQNMEKLIAAVGAQSVDFAHRTSCCGSSVMVTRKEVGEKMSLTILRSITEVDADVVATPCGLCQMNLELAGAAGVSVLGDSIRLPVLNITQLLGLALGVPARQLGLSGMPKPKARPQASTEKQPVTPEKAKVAHVN